jgi:hypothetical protein
VIGGLRDQIFMACIDMLHEFPSKALKGVPLEEVFELLDLQRRQHEAIEAAKT